MMVVFVFWREDIHIGAVDLDDGETNITGVILLEDGLVGHRGNSKSEFDFVDRDWLCKDA